jgi:hypothetical protein
MCTMSAHGERKLKNTLDAIPTAFLVDSSWLTAHGISRFLAPKYLKSGWLERVERGVYRRPAPNPAKPDTLDWKICLLSLQRIMHHPLHVGSMTALSSQGYAHYLSFSEKPTVCLFGARIPNWLGKLPLNAELRIRSLSLFAEPELGIRDRQKDDHDRTLPWDWTLVMSSPERAILEALDELPEHESFHHIDKVFESLTTLSPRTLSAILRSCKKIKVRRLFFVFADRHNHAWRKRLDPEEFNLGTGDRALVKGGKIHPRYRIMVPEEFVTKERDYGA